MLDQFKLWLRSAWYGEAKLWQVFWLGGGLVYLIIKLMTALFLLIDHNPVSVIVGLLIWSFIVFAIDVWWWVSVWRCAHNHTLWKAFGYMARVIVVLDALALIGGGVLITVNHEETHSGYESSPSQTYEGHESTPSETHEGYKLKPSSKSYRLMDRSF